MGWLLSWLILRSSECAENAAGANRAETHAVGRGTGDSLLHKVGAKTHPEDNCSLLRKQLQGTDDNDYRDTFIGGINVTVACGRRYWRCSGVAVLPASVLAPRYMRCWRKTGSIGMVPCEGRLLCDKLWQPEGQHTLTVPHDKALPEITPPTLPCQTTGKRKANELSWTSHIWIQVAGPGHNRGSGEGFIRVHMHSSCKNPRVLHNTARAPSADSGDVFSTTSYQGRAQVSAASSPMLLALMTTNKPLCPRYTHSQHVASKGRAPGNRHCQQTSSWNANRKSISYGSSVIRQK